MRICLVAGLAMVAFSGCLSKGDKDFIQSEWVVTAGEELGESFPEEEVKSVNLSFGDGKFTFRKGQRADEMGFTLEPSKSPKQIDIDRDGNQQLGIYELLGDELKICVDQLGKKRPTELKSASGSQTFVVHKRVKK